jgi:hypothetical protein
MAIPSGSGTEVIKRIWSSNTPANVQTRTAFTVPTDHIYIVLNIHVAENGNATEQMSLAASDAASSYNTWYRFANRINLTAYQTYVHNERIIFHPADRLYVYTANGSNLDYLIHYIDQDWS